MELKQKTFDLVWITVEWRDKPAVNSEYLCAVGLYDETDPAYIPYDEQVFYWFDNYDQLRDGRLEDCRVVAWDKLNTITLQ